MNTHLIILFLSLTITSALADELIALRKALGSISHDEYLSEFDGQDELPERLQYLSFYFESRKRGFRDAKKLLESGIDPNGNATNQESLLTWCSMGGSADAVKLLLSYKANPNKPSPGRWGRLPLIEAARRSFLPSHLRTVDALLQGGADPEIQDASSRNALMSAAEHGSFQGVKLLLKNEADPNARSKAQLHYTNWTALMFAAYRGNPRSAHVLLHGGANPYLESAKGETALSIAIANKHPQTAGVIRRHLRKAEQGSAHQSTTRSESKSK